MRLACSEHLPPGLEFGRPQQNVSTDPNRKWTNLVIWRKKLKVIGKKAEESYIREIF